MVAVCEVVKDPRVKQFQGRLDGDIWVSPREEHVCTRFFLVFPSGRAPRIQSTSNNLDSELRRVMQESSVGTMPETNEAFAAPVLQRPDPSLPSSADPTEIPEPDIEVHIDYPSPLNRPLLGWPQRGRRWCCPNLVFALVALVLVVLGAVVVLRTLRRS